MIIGTDAGHGGSNFGTFDPPLSTQEARLVEKNITLILDKLLAAALSDAPFEHIRTRRSDVYLSQRSRSILTKIQGCNFVLSMHVNHNPDPQCQGAEVYYNPSNPRTSEISKGIFQPALAKVFRKCRLVSVDLSRGEWIRNARNIVMIHDADTVLLELGYRQNPRDRALLMSREGQDKIVTAMKESLLRVADYYGDQP